VRGRMRSTGDADLPSVVLFMVSPDGE